MPADDYLEVESLAGGVGTGAAAGSGEGFFAAAEDLSSLQAELQAVELSLQEKSAALHDIEDREGTLKTQLHSKEKAVQHLSRTVAELQADLESTESALELHQMHRSPHLGEHSLDCLIDTWVAPMQQAAQREGDIHSPSPSSQHWGQARFAMGWGLSPPPQAISPTAMRSVESLRRTTGSA